MFSAFVWLARRLMGTFRRIRRCLRVWYRFVFLVEAKGTLGSFSCKRGLRLQVPVRVGDGKGHLTIGENVTLGFSNAPMLGNGTILLEPRSPIACIEIGDGTYMSNNVSIVAMQSIKIGERCLIGDMSHIFDCDFHDTDPFKRHLPGPIESVAIGDGVWLGSRVTVLRGVTIGDNSVIGTGSIVTRSISSNVVAAGIPCRELFKI